MTYSGSFVSSPVAPQAALIIEEQETVSPEVSVEELITQLITFGSYINQLYTQSHLIHLNIEGPLFLPIHEFLKEQYEAHIAQFDQIAEFVRSMDFLMPMCARGLQGACKGFKHVKSYEAREMLTVYLKNVEAAGMMAKDIGDAAREVKAPDVENYMAEVVGAMFKAAWFLKSTLRD